MTDFVQALLTALAAVTTENIFFSGGIGLSRVLRAARRPRTLGVYSFLIAFFSLVSSLLGTLLNPLLLANPMLGVLRPAILAVCAAAVYAAVSGLLRLSLPGFYKKYSVILPSAAINTVVLSMPYVQRSFQFSLAQAAAFAAGTGIAFFFAATVLNYAVARYQSDEMPEAFRGLPAMLLYIGILSLAFAGLTGGKLF